MFGAVGSGVSERITVPPWATEDRSPRRAPVGRHAGITVRPPHCRATVSSLAGTSYASLYWRRSAPPSRRRCRLPPSCGCRRLPDVHRAVAGEFLFPSGRRSVGLAAETQHTTAESSHAARSRRASVAAAPAARPAHAAASLGQRHRAVDVREIGQRVIAEMDSFEHVATMPAT